MKYENINTNKVIEVFDDFANSLSKPTLYLPPYSLQLNIIDCKLRKTQKKCYNT